MEDIVVTDMWSIYILVMGRKWSKLCEVLQSVSLSGFIENHAFQMHNSFETYRCCTKHASEENIPRNKKDRRQRGERMKERERKERMFEKK